MLERKDWSDQLREVAKWKIHKDDLFIAHSR